jgi:8-hydroxy-5-deazaflavin:NADPH oxidoreductase
MASSKAKIGILGSGNMGRALGIRYSQVGHPVVFGGRSPHENPLCCAQLANSLTGTNNATNKTLDETAQAADILIWTMRDQNVNGILTSNGIEALNGKTVMDLNNRDFAEGVMGGPGKPGANYFQVSLGEQLQADLPKAHIVKAFNTISILTFNASPSKLREAHAQVLIASNNPSANKNVVFALVEELGFEPVDLGDGPAAMRVAEALGDAVRCIMIWGLGFCQIQAWALRGRGSSQIISRSYHFVEIILGELQYIPGVLMPF